MKTVTKLATVVALSAAMSVSVFAETKTPVKADVQVAINHADLSYAFGGSNQDLQVMTMNGQQMQDTEGAVAPLVAVGIMTGSRFIAQRWVTQRVAQNMVRRGATNIMAPNRSIAKRIAGRNPIREFHPGAGSRYTHYHPNPRNGSHVWYGRPR